MTQSARAVPWALVRGGSTRMASCAEVMRAETVGDQRGGDVGGDGEGGDGWEGGGEECLGGEGGHCEGRFFVLEDAG